MNTPRRRAKGGFWFLSGLFADKAPGEMATAHPGRAIAWNDLSTAHEIMEKRALAEPMVRFGVAGGRLRARAAARCAAGKAPADFVEPSPERPGDENKRRAIGE